MKTITKIICIILALMSLSCFLICLHPQGRNAPSFLLFQCRGETGTLEYKWGDGRKEQQFYVKGVRDGIWKYWDKSGKLIRQCEYRIGTPWNGICQIRDQKSWLGEYKDGKPWNGAFSGFTGNTNGDCFVDGHEMSMDSYRRYLNLSSNESAIGLQVTRPKQ